MKPPSLIRWFANLERFAARRQVTLALAIGLPIALAALATLQYRWISRVSETEAERTHAGIEGAARRFADEFNSDLGRLVQSLLIGGPMDRAPTEQDVLQHYWAWLENSADPRILREVFVLTRQGSADFTVRRLDDNEEDFEDAALPERFQSLRGRLEAQWSRPMFPMIAAGDGVLAAVFRPRLRPPNAGRGGPPMNTAGLMLVLELDREFIVTEYLPKLAARNLGRDFVVRVVERGETVFSSVPEADRDRDVPDASAGLLGMPRPGGVPRGPAPRGEMNRPGPPFFSPGGPPGFGQGMPRGMPQGMPAGPAPLWEAHVWPRTGTLDTVVRQARTRNLAISFAVLGLMLAGAAMLMLATRRTQRLARLQMDFVAGVSHELRTPLAVINAAAENIADGVVTEESRLRQYGSLVRQESRRLSEMLEQLLSFAGAQAGNLKLRSEPVPVAGIIEEALRVSRPDLEKHGVAVAVDSCDSLPDAQGDAGLLALCVRNLVANAAKHGGGLPVEIGARAAKGWVEIDVRDHGPGVDPSEEPYLFDPFYRGRRALSDQTPGAGIGLSLVQRIMDAHGGAVSFHSTPDQGATFTLRIPAARGQEEDRDGATADHRR